MALALLRIYKCKNGGHSINDVSVPSILNHLNEVSGYYANKQQLIENTIKIANIYIVRTMSQTLFQALQRSSLNPQTITWALRMCKGGGIMGRFFSLTKVSFITIFTILKQGCGVEHFYFTKKVD